MFNTFYQQDEWQALGHFKALGWESLIENLSLLDILLAKGRILAVVIYDLIFSFSPYNIALITLIVLIFHALNGLLLFVLLKKIFRYIFPSLLGSLFFLLNSVSNQAIIWPGASLSIVCSTSIVLLSLIFFWEFIQKNQIGNFAIAILLILLSLHFKESAVAFIPTYVIFSFLYNRKKLNKKFIAYSSLAIVYFLVFIIFRVGGQLNSSKKVGDYINSNYSVKQTLTVNSILYTLTSPSQIIFPPQFIYKISSQFIDIAYPYLSLNPQSNLIAQSIGTDQLNISISLTALIIILAASFYGKHHKQFVFFTGLLLAGLVPYIIIKRGGSYLESRYYYLLLIPMAGWITLLTSTLYKINNKMPIGIFVFTTLLLFSGYINETNIELTKQKNLAEIRKYILGEIKNDVPTLNKRTIFLIESNSTYIVNNNPLPFQQGIGYTLLVYLYRQEDKKLNKLLINNFLWDAGSEGYLQNNDRGFGYFVNRNKLIHEIKKNDYSKNDVHSFYWDKNKKTLINTSSKLRKVL